MVGVGSLEGVEPARIIAETGLKPDTDKLLCFLRPFMQACEQGLPGHGCHAWVGAESIAHAVGG